MPLPSAFCWTRHGTEAGEDFSQILARKEAERQANQGVFLWGVGNALGPSIRALINAVPQPEVIFSPIKSAPRQSDVAPECVALWTAGETLAGETFVLPEFSYITSRFTSKARSHYALVCYSSDSLLSMSISDELDINLLANYLSGKSIGASQVTSVVKAVPRRSKPNYGYKITMRANLVYPYFLKLTKPIILDQPISLPNQLPRSSYIKGMAIDETHTWLSLLPKGPLKTPSQGQKYFA